jgi:hypothetical protein
VPRQCPEPILRLLNLHLHTKLALYIVGRLPTLYNASLIRQCF